MLILIGTIPCQGLPVISGEVFIRDDNLIIGEESFPLHRGFPAMTGAAAMVCTELGLPPPLAFTAGDVGLGDGSQRLYEYLKNRLTDLPVRVLTFHYLLPDVFWHDHLVETIEKKSQKPVLIADAGYMYVAKMSGSAPFYDLFTPDIGELAFLADELAPHPFYTRGFICHEEDNVPSLISRAYKSENASKVMIVKGGKDYICSKGEILAVIEDPYVEMLEPIGGTGDTLTGIVSALIHGGYAIEDAAIIAAKINRMAGKLANPTPGTQVSEIIMHIPKALSMAI
ncbi:MAG: NAD(P)H-hydrate dehydratase [Thermodesulfovibrionales bacterium]|nr:NAD(P)H-hydrate dehydratase [Thermodesulfovibrionales bacterium]